MAKNKNPEETTLFLPAFFDAAPVAGDAPAISIEFESIKTAKCLYGDSSKCLGPSMAIEWAHARKKVLRLIEVGIKTTNTGNYGTIRAGVGDIDDHSIDILRISLMKNELRDVVSEIIVKAFGEKSQISGMTEIEDWICVRPDIVRALFDYERFSSINTIIVSARAHYAGNTLFNMAVLRSSDHITRVTVLHNAGIGVELDGEMVPPRQPIPARRRVSSARATARH